MTPPNGHAENQSPPRVNGADSALAGMPLAPAPRFSDDRIKQIVDALEVPFDPSVIEWRVTNTSKNGKPRGQVMPYADQRAYTDRLNALFTPAGWTRKYAVHTTPNFERGKDQKTVAKVFVTCELTILGMGSHSATGEEWTDDENACTSAEAQAFKRSCCCLGLGRYLYYFSGEWVDLDERKRPKTAPRLPKWATPDGWREGLRPQAQGQSASAGHAANTAQKFSGARNGNGGGDPGNINALVHQIVTLERALGKSLYRGLLKTIARVWKPDQVQDPVLLERVLAHMQAAERGLRRLDAVLDKTGSAALGPILRSLQIRSLDRIESLETLKQIVVALEASAGTSTQ